MRKLSYPLTNTAALAIVATLATGCLAHRTHVREEVVRSDIVSHGHRPLPDPSEARDASDNGPGPRAGSCRTVLTRRELVRVSTEKSASPRVAAEFAAAALLAAGALIIVPKGCSDTYPSQCPDNKAHGRLALVLGTASLVTLGTALVEVGRTRDTEQMVTRERSDERAVRCEDAHDGWQSPSTRLDDERVKNLREVAGRAPSP